MKERAQEVKAEARARAGREEGERTIKAAIAAMPAPDRAMAKRLHEIVSENAPALMPKTWYGMPAYADQDGKVVCFFQAASKFKARYATFGFNDAAQLDDGAIWATAFAVKELSAAAEKKIAALVKQAAG
ncbi:hypothetical protein DX914_07280 [Lysobacter silvisoli]|uniref:Uncharacterized protein n=2 Tax=Lysobacter silvisoli TaxID=2293254 RepID=A0A371K791_9GAMM|nr:hypothetical protein DX914_07280 [Lysobacter silvisoli]